MKEFWELFLVSAAAGILSGWGVGGGTLLLLVLTLFLGVEHRTAQAVNMLFFLPAAVTSLFFHRKNGRIDGRVWVRTALPGAVAALTAALAALTVDVTLLRKPFGLFLLWTGLTALRSVIRER